MALAARQAVGLSACDQFDALAYAQKIGVVLLDFDTLPISPSARKQLLVADPESWSGMTIKQDRIVAVILNPAHGPARRASTLMHEIAHVDLGHSPVRVDISPTGILLVSEFSKDDEEEADWLAGAFLLPREALVAHRARGRDAQQIAQRHGISVQLCEWRLRMTGVDLQIRRARG